MLSTSSSLLIATCSGTSPAGRNNTIPMLTIYLQFKFNNWMETVSHLLYDQFTRWVERCRSACAGFPQFAPLEETKLFLLSTLLAFFIPSASIALSSLFRTLFWCWPCPVCARFTTPFSGPCSWLLETMRAKQLSKPWAWATSAGVCPLLFLRLVKTRLHWPQALL